MTVGFSAPLGFRGVSAVTEGETASSSSSALLVNQSTPAGLNYTPTTAQQGTTLNLLLNGLGTTWVNGVTTATFGSNNGLVVTALNVTSPTQATLSLTVQGTASVGFYTLTVTTDHGGGNIEQIIVPNSFTVAQGAAIITSVSPNQGTQATTLPISVVGQNTNFQNGVTTARFVLGGCGSSADPGINVTNVAVVDSTHATLSIAISSTAQTGLRTLCLATLGENVGYGNAFTVLSATPTLNGVSPVSGEQGQSLTLNIIGQFTHWVQGVTTATFGQGITVQSLAIDPNGTSATAIVLIDPLAFPGGRTVTITTGGEIVSGNLFSVARGPAILSSITPATANQGTQNLQVQILGQNTHWSPGITQFSITGANYDITVNGFQVQNATSAIAEISLSPTANLGTRTLFLSTGGEKCRVERRLPGDRRHSRHHADFALHGHARQHLGERADYRRLYAVDRGIDQCQCGFPGGPHARDGHHQQLHQHHGGSECEPHRRARFAHHHGADRLAGADRAHQRDQQLFAAAHALSFPGYRRACRWPGKRWTCISPGSTLTGSPARRTSYSARELL